MPSAPDYRFAVLAVAADKILECPVLLENKYMVHQPVQEMPVMRDDDKGPLELLEILLQHVQCHDVQIIRRFVHNQEVRLTHQYGEKVEPAFLPS